MLINATSYRSSLLAASREVAYSALYGIGFPDHETFAFIFYSIQNPIWKNTRHCCQSPEPPVW